MKAATDAWRMPPKLDAPQFQALCGIFKSLIELGHAPPKDLLNVIRPIYESFSWDEVGSTVNDVKQAARTAGIQISQPLSPEESRLAVSSLVERVLKQPNLQNDFFFIATSGLSSADAADHLRHLIDATLASEYFHENQAGRSKLAVELAQRLDPPDVFEMYLFVMDRSNEVKDDGKWFFIETANVLVNRFGEAIPPDVFPKLVETFLQPNFIIWQSWEFLLPKLSKEQRGLIGECLAKHLQKASDADFLRYVVFWSNLFDEIGKDFHPNFASAFVDQCSTRYRQTRRQTVRRIHHVRISAGRRASRGHQVGDRGIVAGGIVRKCDVCSLFAPF